MPSKRTHLQLFAAFVASLLFVAAAPTPVASASGEEPPFELRFPQETDKTVWTSTFGAGRSGGRRHKGNDLMAPKMTEVYAVADGVVERVARGSSAGRYIVIAHEDGWTSSYMHLNNDTPGTDNGRADWSQTLAPGIDEGTVVAAGDLIGWVGDSGNAEWTGPHTHFELRKDGRAVNPFDDLLAALARDEARLLFDFRPAAASIIQDQIS